MIQRRPKKLKENIRFLVDGAWIDEHSYLHIPEADYERVVKRRKKLKMIKGVDNS